MSLPPLTGLSIALVLGAIALTFILQPFFLGWSAMAVGEKRPSWLVAFAALITSAITGTIGQLIYGFTLGLLIAKLGQIPMVIGGFAVSLGISAIVYSAFLRVSVARGAAVAAVYWIASAAWFGGLALVLKLVLG